MENTLTVAGCGIMPARDITLGTLRRVASSAKVLHLSFPDGEALLRSWGARETEDLGSLYVDGAVDTDNYKSILARVLTNVSQYKDVVLLLPGHPRVGVTLMWMLENSGIANDMTITVLPGISSFDTMLNDLRLDPLERGTIVTDANRILLFRTKLDPTINLFVYHICSVGTSKTNTSQPARDNHLASLASYLINVYGAEYEASLLTSEFAPGRAINTVVKLKALARQLPQIGFDTSLFVPARRPDVDRSFLRSIGYLSSEDSQL